MVGQELISQRILVSVKLDHWLVLQEDGAGGDNVDKCECTYKIAYELRDAVKNVLADFFPLRGGGYPPFPLRVFGHNDFPLRGGGTPQFR